jgi:hypothetical protein
VDEESNRNAKPKRGANHQQNTRLKRGGRPWGKACRQAVPIGGIGTAGRDKRDIYTLSHLVAKDFHSPDFFTKISDRIVPLLENPPSTLRTDLKGRNVRH